ncbi:MAG: aminotransferase class V-fold PLP-dependent enzyme [Candidatus Aminicenantes bacterium]|nr:MAG: aminotransferase class V-fold PLP-dependent enzyme [Candidatus Aminicenantes bacterium]
MTNWKKIRKDFPITKKGVYFQSAAMSPIPTPVFAAIVKNYRKIHQQGDVLWTEDSKKYRKLCGDIAALINTESDNVCFVQNTSTAMSLIALSFENKIKTPYNVVSTEDEFPASTIGFEYREIPMRYVPPKNSRYPIDSILEQTDGQTAAVVTSYVQYATGFRQDLQNLGKALQERGILFIVNATQAFPFYPVDIQAMHIDALTCSLHKWGMTGHVGSIFFTTPEFRERFSAPWIGWLSLDAGKYMIHTAKNAPFSVHDSARRFEFGTQNLQTILAFQDALDYLKAIGFENIRKRILELTDYLIQGLKKQGVTIVSPTDKPEERSPLVSFSLGERNKECIKRLTKESISVSPRAGFIRVSINIFNNFVDIDKLLSVLQSVL